MRRSVYDKSVLFLAALKDVYRDEEKRELDDLGKLEFPEDADFTGDMTAMVVAMAALCQAVTGWEGDLIDFTLLLSKLMYQYLMETDERKDSGD